LDKAETFQFRDLVLEVAATTRLTVQITKMNLFLLGTVECVVDQALKTHRPSDFPHQPQFETVDLTTGLIMIGGEVPKVLPFARTVCFCLPCRRTHRKIYLAGIDILLKLNYIHEEYSKNRTVNISTMKYFQPTFCLVINIEHCNGAPNILCGFQANESDLVKIAQEKMNV
jgi:hypothetical protein